MEPLTINNLCGYLPYGLCFMADEEWPYNLRGIRTNKIIAGIILGRSIERAFTLEEIKPILFPLSDLTKPITINGETFVPIEYFEIGDDIDHDYPYEFNSGNIKFIQDLKTLAKYNISHDINFLPYAVVQKLFEWKFAINLPEGSWIDVNSLEENPYK